MGPDCQTVFLLNVLNFQFRRGFGPQWSSLSSTGSAYSVDNKAWCVIVTSRRTLVREATMTIEKLNQETVRELKEKVATGCRILAKLGLADYLGHVSARVPGTKYVLIKARGTDLGNLLEMTPERVIMVDLEANQVEGKDRASSEVKLHTEVFKARPDVMGLVHTHQHLATAFGAAGKPILPMLGIMSVVCAKPMPIFQSSLKIVTAEQGAAVARVLGDALGCHLKNH